MPHSEIDGSKPVCGSPSLIAAYHVLHRLLAPRHPPCALSSLTIRTRNCHVLTSTLNPKVEGCSQPAAISVNTHCECVVGKLPLQSIQLSKSPSRGLRRDRPYFATTPSSCAPAQSFESRPNLFQPSPASPRARGTVATPAGLWPAAAERASAPPANTGGEYRARTGDLLVANQALSQLS